MISKKIVRYNYTKELIDSLGKYEDKDVAKEFGISKDAALYKRRKLGIPSHRSFMAGKGRLEDYPSELISVLGTNFDTILSKEYNISSYTICRLRKRFGIKGYKSEKIIKLNCNHCGIEIKKYPYQISEHNFCSGDCYYSYMRENKSEFYNHKYYENSTKGKFIECDWCKEEFYRPNSLINNGNNFCGRDCYNKWYKENLVGEKHPYYVGGYSHYYGRGWFKQKDLILRRDKICLCCSSNEKLHIHHIIPYRISKDNSIGNLITLCNSCHKKIEHKYLKIETRPQYFEEINSMRVNQWLK